MRPSMRKPPASALALLAVLWLALAGPVLAAEPEKGQAQAGTPAAEPRERFSETTHTLRLGGKSLEYRALAGELLLRDEAEKPEALMFYVAYLARDAKPAERPITFLFNGGPGSSAIWLHLGAFGPKRVSVDEDGHPGPPPYGVVDNPWTLLDLTDLVFVDPVSTGYSRAVEGKEAKPFHEVHKDVEAMAELIRRFLVRHGRWESPLFIAGESYGTIRGAGVADLLLRRHYLYLSGLVLISPALNQMTFRDGNGNDLPYVLSLPAFAATAWYHRRLEPALQGRSLEEVMAEAEAFSLGDYARALLLGAALPAEERARIVAQLARLTGVRAEELERRNLRISSFDYTLELLRDQRLQVGLLDSRYRGFPNSLAAEPYAAAYQYALYDPSDSAVSGVFAAALQQYLRRDLRYDSEAVYEVLSLPVAASWDYNRVTNRYLYAADNLRSVMSANPDMDVFMANGHYDLVTTSLATRYVADHLGIDPRLRESITLAYYPSGHMMYMHEPSLAELKEDLARFYRTALEKRPSLLAKPAATATH